MPKRFSICAGIVILSTFLCSCDELPSRVEVSAIPSYYFENGYLEGRVDAINKALDECSEDYEAFFWITDIHWEPGLNERRSPLLIKYIASKTGINKILNGGDTGNSQIICKNAIAQLREAIGSNRVYTVNGNHEIVDATRYELPFERVAEELRGHNSELVYGDQRKSYFYFDDSAVKTRYIGLSSFGLYFNQEYESCYSPEQLEWLKYKALNVETGWTIIVFTHTLYHVNIESDTLGTGPSGANSFIDVIDHYSGKGKIACVMIGHTHRDRVHIGSSGIPYILSASDRHATYLGDINVTRTPGTINEQHFEVIVLDKSKREIKLFSIGAPAKDGFDNDPGNEVWVRTVRY